MKKADIIIFGGQSNMQGQSERLSECEAVEGAFEYKYFGNILVPLKNPVGENICYDGLEGDTFMHGQNGADWCAKHVLGSACYGHTNLVPSFCRAYIKETGKQVIALHAAKGSTVIADWLPGTDGYKWLCAKSLAAINKVKEEYCIGHIYFTWLQGESDAINANSCSYYKEKIGELADALRKDLGVERFGVIRVGYFVGDDRDDEIIRAQDEICAEDPFFLMLTTIATELNKMPDMMHPDIKGHYSAKGLETLGRLSGETLGKNRGL